MLDSRRDCRYRRGDHRSIGAGIREVTFHAIPGAQKEVPGFPLPLYVARSRKIGCEGATDRLPHGPLAPLRDR
jgi:hypothetical protein